MGKRYLSIGRFYSKQPYQRLTLHFDRKKHFTCLCILNSEHNEGYDNCAWSITCDPDAVLTPHALAVNPEMQGKGIGKVVVENILNIAREEHKKAVRLDVLGACKSAERLYISCGFQFVEAKEMYYEDTGWTKFKMFELNL